jgi:predicted kinase
MKSLSPSQPHAIIMVGIPGCGKSLFAERFADTFGAPYLADVKIAHAANGINPEHVAHIALYQLDELLKTGQSLVVDSASDTHAERLELGRKARKAGYEALFVWVQVDRPTAELRSVKSKDAAITAEEFDRRLKRFTPPNAIEKPLVISGKHTYATQAKVVLKRLSAPRTDNQQIKAPPRASRPQARRNNIVVR